MKKPLKFPFAFCVELGRLITPEEAGEYLDAHPGHKLTFTCPRCGKMLVRQAHRRGRENTHVFRARKGEPHRTCYRPDASDPQDQSFRRVSAPDPLTQIETCLKVMSQCVKTLRERGSEPDPKISPGPDA